MDFKELIKTDGGSARAELIYRGSPEAGMLAWLDSTELKQWWKADSVIIEPFHGGIFYVTWYGEESSKQHAIYGIMDKVDTEANIVEVNKIMYISPNGKMGHLHMHISFEPIGNGQTKLTLVHTHSYTGQLQKTYYDSVFASWPKSMALLKKYLEAKSRPFS